MVVKLITPGRNVVNFRNDRSGPRRSRTLAMHVRCCRHCDAALGDDESEDECSSAGLAPAYPIRASAPR